MSDVFPNKAPLAHHQTSFSYVLIIRIFMLILHHLNSSRSQRIVWLLELAGLDYEIKVYKRDEKSNLAPAALKKIHPLGTAPMLTDGELTLAESGVICEYIASKCDKDLLPAQGSKEYMDVQFWSHYAEGSFMPPLVASLVLNKAREKAPFLIKPIANGLIDAIMNAYYNVALKRNFEFVEQYLTGKKWLVGDKISLADIQMSFGMEAIYDAGRLADFPNMKAYVQRMRAELSHQTAMKKMQEAENA